LDSSVPNSTLIDGVSSTSTPKIVPLTSGSCSAGYDFKLIGQVPYLPWAKIKGTRYHWDGKQDPDTLTMVLT
jgi:hypothetical protein